MLALISDIHGNLEALTSVLDDIARFPVDIRKQTIEWRRVEYDIAAVVKKSEAMCGKDTWCAQRLLTGR